MTWKCPKCMYPTNFATFDWCARCGEHKPAPPPEEKPKPKKVMSVA